MLPLVSVIVPAYNEHEYLDNCLRSILAVTVDKSYELEILVIDNGSTDNTVEIGRKYTDKVFSIDRSTVSVARNFGVKKSIGQIIVFIDADVRLTESWGNELSSRLDAILDSPQLTGARYIVREDPSWIERCWFKPLSEKQVEYINGGNIILSRQTFEKIGGFSERLETGEDYEFSMRAKSQGVTVINNPKFEAIHDGYPSTISRFIKREIWHGKGDYLNLATFIRSKVAIAALSFGFLHLIFLGALIFATGSFLTVVSLGLIFLVTLAMSIRIFLYKGFGTVLQNIPVCYLYLVSRFISLLVVLREKFL